MFRRAPRPRCPGLVASFYHQLESTQALRGMRIALGSDSAVLSHRTLGCPSTSPLLVLLVWLQLSMVLPKLWLKELVSVLTGKLCSPANRHAGSAQAPLYLPMDLWLTHQLYKPTAHPTNTTPALKCKGKNTTSSSSCFSPCTSQYQAIPSPWANGELHPAARPARSMQQEPQLLPPQCSSSGTVCSPQVLLQVTSLLSPAASTVRSIFYSTPLELLL